MCAASGAPALGHLRKMTDMVADARSGSRGSSGEEVLRGRLSIARGQADEVPIPRHEDAAGEVLAGVSKKSRFEGVERDGWDEVRESQRVHAGL